MRYTILFAVLSLVLGTSCGSRQDAAGPGSQAGAGGTLAPTSAPPATPGLAGGATAPAAAGGPAVAAPAGAGGSPIGPVTSAGSSGSAEATAGSSAGGAGTAAAAGSGSPADPTAPRPSPGCTGGTLVAGRTQETIAVGSGQREYVQTVPASYDGTQPFAVLIDFHGGTYDGPRWDARASNRFPELAETERFLYLAPTGLGAWWTTTEGADGDDGQFMRALIDHLKQSACVDERRIYATGCSMGGDMSFFMACYFSDVIAASLPMCGTMSFALTECQPTRPISLRFIMGSRDSLNCWEPPRTTVGNPCASEVKDTFGMLNGCTDGAEMTHGGLCLTHDECEGGTEVSVCMLDATHTGIYQAADMDVYAEGWSFLKGYTLP